MEGNSKIEKVSEKRCTAGVGGGQGRRSFSSGKWMFMFCSCIGKGGRVSFVCVIIVILNNKIPLLKAEKDHRKKIFLILKTNREASSAYM